MVDQFYLVYEEEQLDSYSLKHIQYNVHKRLQILKYVSYKRIDVCLVEAEVDIMVERDDKKKATLKCRFERSMIEDVSEKKTIAYLYNLTFKCLMFLWSRNSWNVEDLDTIHSDIVAENYLSSIFFGKTLFSPDKNHKAAFLCELYPEFANYYLCFFERKGDPSQKILFLHGHSDPDLFFYFFSNRVWRDNDYFLLSNITKEVFYIFNVNQTDFLIEYRPLNNTLEECKNYITAFQADIPISERLKLLGMPG
jgi:hypothetical protein